MPFNQTGDNATANIGTYNDNTIIHTGSSQEQADIAAIRSLKIADNPGGNQHQVCTANTRVQIRQDIREWAEDTTTKNQIFWLADRAGTGKSTVAKQIVEDWKAEKKAAVSFVFSIAAADTKSNAKFCQTIAAKLGDLPDFGSFRSILAEALRRNLTVETFNFNDKFEELLCAPLKKTNKPVLIVIDALDECNDRSELLSVLLSKLEEIPMVKVMITSRPEPDIVEQLRDNELVLSSNLGDFDSTTEDIRRYISDMFAHTKKLQRIESYAPKLAEEANGVFIYASTACKYLKKSLNPNAALKKLGQLRGLDDLYLTIMERAIPGDDPDSLQAASSVLQIILAAQRPLSIPELQELLKEDVDVESIVEALASVLSSGAEDRPVETFHATFQEYLTDRGRSGVYFVDVKMGHKSLAISCLEIYSAKSTAFLIKLPENITAILEYAARCWPIHAAVSLREANAQEDLEGQIISFFKQHLIHWFESTARLDAVSQCINNLATLEASTPIAFATATSPTSSMYERKRWCRDSQRFLQYHQSGIEQGYNHIRGALSFTPRESLIYKAYFATFSGQIPTVLCGIPTEWPSYQILSGHTGPVEKVAISPDGTRIVSASKDTTLRLWDGVTGARIGRAMEGHNGSVTDVAFSPDGTRVVSASEDLTLRLWDGVTGTSIGGSMEGHTKWITSVAFSPDGTRVVSCSYDSTLRLWNGMTGASIGRPMEGHEDVCTSVAFSPDGARVVSGSYDHTLRLWDGVTGASIGEPLEGHTDSVTDVAFSPDGTRIVSASEDFTLRLWNGVTGASIGRAMKGHTNDVNHVSFSPDGTRVASASSDKTLRLWNGVTGASIGKSMKGHASSVTGVAFSSDGTRVVSASGDYTLRLWDGVTGTRIGGPMNGHTAYINGVAFFPDGTHVVSASDDHSLRVWDGVTGGSIGRPMNGHTANVTNVAFSPDGTRVVSASYDETLRLWDGVTGASIGRPMKGHTAHITNVAFSPDGTRVVSASHDSTLRLWNGVTGANIGRPMEGHTNSVVNVAFSPDGTRIVSASRDHTLRLWNGMTGASIGEPMEGHTDYVTDVAFSLDGTRIVSASNESTLRLWNGITGTSIGGPMEGHSEEVTRVSFSPDGSRVVSASDDRTLRLWNSMTGASIGEPMKGHTAGVVNVAFSPDGNRIVSAADDNTLRLWDVSSSAEVAFISIEHFLYQFEFSRRAEQLRRVEFSTCGSYILLLGSIWDIVSLPPSPVDRSNPAVSGRSFSRITYDEQSRMIEVHSSSVSNFPVPGCLVYKWMACGGRIALGLEDGGVVIIDCTHLL